MSNLSELYPHISFSKRWTFTEEISFLLGQCDALIQAINNTPIMPDLYNELLKVSLKKGAQATTAIEGNTLTDDEVERVLHKETLPPSKEYQQIEVSNILEALNELFQDAMTESGRLIMPDLLLRFHRLIGKGLGEHFQAIPGQFRQTNVTVGGYRAPDSTHVLELIDKLCEWMKEEFGFGQRKQEMKEVIIQAIVAHIYIEWIHPFGDGNGRSGRLVEFYILMRGGSPNIASHILSNHYNDTRNEYYRQIQQATQKRDLTDFIKYALIGFRDGLASTLARIQSSQLLITWQRLVYDKFDKVVMGKKDVFKRRRNLALDFPLDRQLPISSLPDFSISMAKAYSGKHIRTLHRDVQELVALGILVKSGDLIKANLSLLHRMMAIKKTR